MSPASTVRVKRTRAALLSLALALALSAPGRTRPPVSYILFAVETGERGQYLDPVARVGADGAVAEPFDRDSDVSSNRFVARWLTPGRSYPVLRGGAAAGAATVRERPGDPGISHQSRVTLSRPTDPDGDTFGLAVSRADAAGTKSKSLGRRRILPPEAQAVVTAAVPVFRKYGVSAEAARTAKLLSGSALDLDGTGGQEIVARLQATEKKGPRCDLFVIATPTGAAAYTIALGVPHKNNGTVEDLFYVEQSFVDALDLDQDGIAEVVTRSVYYESHDYTIYRKRRGGSWRSIYRGAGGGV